MKRLLTRSSDERGAHLVEWGLGVAILVVGLMAVIAFNEQAWSRRVQTGRCQYQDYDVPDPVQGPMIYNSNRDLCCLNGNCP